MSFDNMLQQKKQLKLIANHPTNVRIGRLPKGKYVYWVTVRKPGTFTAQLQVQVKTENALVHQCIFEVQELTERLGITFQSEGIEMPYTLSFLITGTDTALLLLPISAQKVQNSTNVVPNLSGFEGQLLQKMNAYEIATGNKINKHSSKATSSAEQKTLSQMNEVESFINARYFRGFLSLKEAEHQLDHVVLTKLFQPDGTRGFNKYKRAFYRRVIINIYRLVTKNRNRKVYFAKLYRNYVNNNLISENFHQH